MLAFVAIPANSQPLATQRRQGKRWRGLEALICVTRHTCGTDAMLLLVTFSHSTMTIAGAATTSSHSKGASFLRKLAPIT